MWCQKIQRMVVSSSFWCSPCSQTTGPSRLSMWWVLTRPCTGYLVVSRGILFLVATYVYDCYMYMERERECPELSWEIFGIIIFPFWSVLFFWISCSVRICPHSLLFATFWSWKLPFQRYLQHFGVRTTNFPWYLQHFGAPSVHVACIFATRVHLGLI